MDDKPGGLSSPLPTRACSRAHILTSVGSQVPNGLQQECKYSRYGDLLRVSLTTNLSIWSCVARGCRNVSHAWRSSLNMHSVSPNTNRRRPFNPKLSHCSAEPRHETPHCLRANPTSLSKIGPSFAGSDSGSGARAGSASFSVMCFFLLSVL